MQAAEVSHQSGQPRTVRVVDIGLNYVLLPVLGRLKILYSLRVTARCDYASNSHNPGLLGLLQHLVGVLDLVQLLVGFHGLLHPPFGFLAVHLGWNIVLLKLRILPSFSWPQAHRYHCGGPLRKATEGEVEPPVQQLADMLAGAGGADGDGVGAGEGVPLQGI